MGIRIFNRHRSISITVHVRVRMYHYRDVPYIPYLPTTVATTLFSYLDMILISAENRNQFEIWQDPIMICICSGPWKF